MCFQANAFKAQFLFQLSEDTCVVWNYADGEEFNADTLSASKWHTAFPWSRSGLAQDIYFTEKNIFINDGIARFRVNQEKTTTHLNTWEYDTAIFKRLNKFPGPRGTFEHRYTGGLIWSKKQYQYGYFELRFKNTLNVGLWPAFWMYGAENNEIDFMELKSERDDEVHIDVHCNDGCDNYIKGILKYKKAYGHWVKAKGSLSEYYNIVSGEWQKDHIKFFLNGDLIGVFKGAINVPLALTVGNGNAFKGGPFPPGVGKETVFPSDFYIDYLRIWTLDSTVKKKREFQDFTPVEITDSQKAVQKGKKIRFSKKVKGESNELLTISILPAKNGTTIFTILGNETLRKDLSISFKDETGKIIQNVSQTNIDIQILPLNLVNGNKIFAEIAYHGHKYNKQIAPYKN